MTDLTLSEAINNIKGNPSASKPFYEALQSKFLSFIDKAENIDKVLELAEHPIWSRWILKITDNYCDATTNSIVPTTPEHMELFKSLNTLSIDDIKALGGQSDEGIKTPPSAATKDE